MSVTAVVGAQWGDEGKGKLAHLLSKHYDIVLRFQGGSNAGHTVKVDGQTYKFKLIPSGMLHPDVRCLICDGVVLNPGTLVEEREQQEFLLQAIRQLPPERQQLLILKFVEQMRNAEIAGVMGRTEGAIKSLYHRTLVALRQELANVEDGREEGTVRTKDV